MRLVFLLLCLTGCAAPALYDVTEVEEFGGSEVTLPDGSVESATFIIRMTEVRRLAAPFDGSDRAEAEAALAEYCAGQGVRAASRDSGRFYPATAHWAFPTPACGATAG